MWNDLHMLKNAYKSLLRVNRFTLFCSKLNVGQVNCYIHPTRGYLFELWPRFNLQNSTFTKKAQEACVCGTWIYIDIVWNSIVVLIICIFAYNLVTRTAWVLVLFVIMLAVCVLMCRFIILFSCCTWDKQGKANKVLSGWDQWFVPVECCLLNKWSIYFLKCTESWPYRHQKMHWSDRHRISQLII